MVKQNRPAQMDPLTFDELARSPATHLKALRASREGLSIAYKGKRAAVMVDPEEYRSLRADREELELRKSLDRSFEQARRGEVRDALEVVRELRAEIRGKYGKKRGTKKKAS